LFYFNEQKIVFVGTSIKVAAQNQVYFYCLKGLFFMFERVKQKIRIDQANDRTQGDLENASSMKNYKTENKK
jgi:hypothetical protein